METMKEFEKLAKQAHFTAMAKMLLRQGIIDTSLFNVLMQKIESMTS